MSLSSLRPKKKHIILIFRQNLFRASETFIPLQTKNLERYQPLYMGRVQWGKTPSGQKAVSLWQVSSKKRSFREVFHFLKSIFSLSAKVWLKLTTKEQQEEIKLIHAHFGPDAVRALPIAEALNVPLITNFHGFDVTLNNWRFLTSPVWFPYPFLKKSLAKKGAIFLCPSRFIKKRVLEMGFPKERTILHHVGINLTEFSLRSPEREENYLLHVARLVPVKGTSILIKALSLLSERHKHIKLVLIGEGDLRKKLEALAEELSLSNRVIFMGSCTHDVVKDYTSRAMISILPSIPTADGREEGLGLALVEASACGVPVIGSRSGGIPETMDEGETGFLVPPADPHALAEKITYLLDNKELRIEMGKAGRKFVEREFSQTTQNKTLEAIYNSLL
ncbi:glycosyltransferase [Acetobacteraceae bacterium]|nr:glycosyltransferase [Acetobacteraceae bacterium]